MTITILSLVCIVLAALCLCLWFYAANVAEDAAEAMWELDQTKWEAEYFERQTQKYSDMCLQLKRGLNL